MLSRTQPVINMYSQNFVLSTRVNTFPSSTILIIELFKLLFLFLNAIKFVFFAFECCVRRCACCPPTYDLPTFISRFLHVGSRTESTTQRQLKHAPQARSKRSTPPSQKLLETRTEQELRTRTRYINYN